MKNSIVLSLMSLSLMITISCQRSTGDDDDTAGSDPTDTGSTDSSSDDTPGNWNYVARQDAIGSAAVTCATGKLTTADCAASAPSPCVPKKGKIICQMVIKDNSGATEYDGVIGIEQWGRGSGVYDKPNYELEMRLADGVTENPAAILGMGKEEDWILDGAWTDRTLMRQDLVFDIFKELGGDTHVAADSRYVTLTLNGEAQGIYKITERLKRDDDRVNIEEDASGLGENFILKLDDDGNIKNISIGADQDDWMTIYPSDSKVTNMQTAGITMWLTELQEEMVEGEGFKMLNMDTVVDWVLMNEFSKNIRTYEKGWYLFKSGSNKANLIPFDADMTFGQPDTDATGWVPHNAMTAYLLADTAFKSALATRWAELRAGALSEVALNQRIDDYLKALPDDAISANFTLWPMDDVDLSVVESDFNTPAAKDFAGEIDTLRQWIADRLTWMDSNIASYQ